MPVGHSSLVTRSSPAGHSPAIHATARPGGVVTTRRLARWLLLGVVIAAVFGLHVLTVDHGDHGDLPVAVADGHSSAQSGDTALIAAALAAGQPAPIDSPVPPADDGDGWLAGCVLFLGVGSGLVLLLHWIRRRIGDPPASAASGGSVAFCWRAPIAPLPRLALGVIRV